MYQGLPLSNFDRVQAWRDVDLRSLISLVAIIFLKFMVFARGPQSLVAFLALFSRYVHIYALAPNWIRQKTLQGTVQKAQQPLVVKNHTFSKIIQKTHIHIVKRRSGLGVDRCRSLKFDLPRFYNFSLLGFRTGPTDMIAFQHIFLISSFMLLRHSGSSTRPFGALQEAYQPLIVENHIFSKI